MWIQAMGKLYCPHSEVLAPPHFTHHLFTDKNREAIQPQWFLPQLFQKVEISLHPNTMEEKKNNYFHDTQA